MNTLNCNVTGVYEQDSNLVVSPQVPLRSASDVVQIGDRLHEAIMSHGDLPELVQAIVSLLAECVVPTASLYHVRDCSGGAPQNGTLQNGKCFQGSLEGSGVAHDQIITLGNLACSCGHIVSDHLADRHLYIYATPVYKPQGEPDVLAFLISASTTADANVARLIELAATHIAWWHFRRLGETAEREAESTAALLELLEVVETSSDLSHACHQLASQLQAHLECQQVAIALSRRGSKRNRLRAISGVESFDRHAPLVAAMEAALDEAVVRDVLTCWPPQSPADRPGTLAHKHLSDVGGVSSVVSSPLRNGQGECVGAWLLLGTRQHLDTPRVLNFLRASETRVATSLSLIRRAQCGPITRWCRDRLAHRRGTKLGIILIALTVSFGVLAIPTHYMVRCDCRIEPVSRRFAAAPYDGILQESFVTAGATVVRGDSLARMDGREIHWELAAIKTQRDRAAKKYNSAFANRKFSAAEIAQLEVEGLESKIELLEQRQDDLIVRSPIDGIVTAGDLDQAQGAPVTRGQTLFEIAPLNTMVVEVAVPEREVPHVRQGQTVLLSLESRPGIVYEGTIKQIDPRAEIRDQHNVFIAQVVLANPNGELRPGMRGTAKIEAPRHALAWNLFHKPWESLCMAFGW